MKKTKLPATDHQIFERYHKFNIKTAIRSKYHLKRIDNVVRWRLCNIDHGIGRFGGLQKNTGREQNTGSYKTGLC
jgi:hypothetical protein